MSVPHLNMCPACGAEKRSHSRATEDDYEAWSFACGAEVLRYENGKLDTERPCGKALQKSLDRLNIVFAGTKPTGHEPSEYNPGDLLNAVLLELVRMCEVDNIGRTSLRLDDVVLNGKNVGTWEIDLRKADGYSVSRPDRASQ